MPSVGGTPILNAAGNPAVVAEANVPELYLPITQANIDSLFKAAGVRGADTRTENSLVYSPVFTINLGDNDTEAGEEILRFLRNEGQRDLLAIVEDARRKFSVGRL